MSNTSVSVSIDTAALGLFAKEARREVVRTLAFELLRRSTENVTDMKAIDTGNLRASGHVVLGGDAAAPDLAEDEAEVRYGAAYAEAVHEGLGSNRKIGPRPFLHQAAEDVQADAQRIAEDILRRKFGG